MKLVGPLRVSDRYEIKRWWKKPFHFYIDDSFVVVATGPVRWCWRRMQHPRFIQVDASKLLQFRLVGLQFFIGRG